MLFPSKFGTMTSTAVTGALVIADLMSSTQYLKTPLTPYLNLLST